MSVRSGEPRLELSNTSFSLGYKTKPACEAQMRVRRSHFSSKLDPSFVRPALLKMVSQKLDLCPSCWRMGPTSALH